MASLTSPTVRRRRLAGELRRLRERSGMTCDEVAEQLGCTGSRISRVENGRLGIRPGDVREMLDLYEVTGDEVKRLVQLSRDARQRGWWQTGGGPASEALKTVIGLETEASSILEYEPHFVPGLLQTEAYARELISRWRPSVEAETVERLTEVRMTRQNVLTRENPPDLWVVLDEAVIRHTVGNPGVMRLQLERLVEASELRNVTIQIIPFDSGAYVAMGTAFLVFEFPNPLDESVAYTENLIGGMYLEGPEEVATCTLAFNHLRAAALPDFESVALVRKVASSL